MHAGARRSLQFCPKPDEVQAAREKEAAERLVALIEDKLSNIGPPGSSPLRNVRGDDTVSFPPAGHRIVLLELFAGIGTGLEAALRAGLVIDKYIYCDPNNVASNIADTRCKQLLERFPSQVTRSTFYKAFDHETFPQDVRDITQKHLHSLGQLDLVIAGWECQGFSRAGNWHGLKDPRSALFLDLVKVLNWARELYPNVAFVLENTHHDLAIDELREDILIVQNYIGKPLVIDAAQCSSYAH